MAILIQLPGDKRTFVAGMYWRHEDRFPNRKSLLEGSRNRDYWVTTRRTRAGSIQSGFCEPLEDAGRTDKPLKKTVYSLAGAVAEIMEDPWLGIFDLGDGLYWYIAVRDNHEILPDGDIIGDFDTVNRARQLHVAYGDWKSLPDDNIESLGEILKKTRKPPRIKDLRRKIWVPMVFYGGTTALVVGSALGGMIYYHHYEERIIEEKRIALMHRIAVTRAMDAKKAAANVPWRTTAMPSRFISACLNRAFDVKFSEKGWVLQNIWCQSGVGGTWTASADWMRGIGSTALNHPEGQLAKNGNAVVNDLFGAGRLGIPHDSGIWTEDAASTRLYGVTQLLGMVLHLDVIPPVPVLDQSKNNKNKTLQKPWKAMHVDLKLPLAEIKEASKMLDTIPGLRIQKINIPVIQAIGKKSVEKLNMKTINMTGELYVKQH